jgi:hypothetical protein
MHLLPPPPRDPHWVYDDPSGVPDAEPQRLEPPRAVPTPLPRPIPTPALPKAA